MNESKENLLLVFSAIVVAIALLVMPNSDVPKTQIYYESHTVKEGETLSEIVEDHHGSLKRTQYIYPGNANVIMPGSEIQIVVEVQR